MVLIESEEGIYECKWSNIVRKDRKQLRKWLPEIFEDEETDLQLVSKQSIEGTVFTTVIIEQRCLKHNWMKK
jgi:hypothetical protein